MKDFKNIRELLLRPRWEKQPRDLVRFLVAYIREQETRLFDMACENYHQSQLDFQGFCILTMRDALDKVYRGREPI